jgi:RimJ/RimL family protein N-acetyltransferase
MNYNFWQGEKIRLRAIVQKDLDDLLMSTEPHDTELDRFENEIVFPLSKMQERQARENLIRKDDSDDNFFWMIEDVSGTLVGFINTFDCERRHGTFKYAVIIKREFWRKGYAKEALMIVLRYYFRELRYQKMTAMVYAFNEPSIQFHQNFGFVLEGRIRRMVYTNGTFYDTLYFGMTSEEFEKLDPKLELKDILLIPKNK